MATLHYNLATQAYVQQQVQDVTGIAPETLNSLSELASAINNDPDFFNTLNTSLSTKADIATTLAGYGITDAYTQAEITSLLAAQNEAGEIAYDNTTSLLTATNVQAVIDEIEARLKLAEAEVHAHLNKDIIDQITAAYTTDLDTKLAGIEDGATADQTKADIDALGINAATVNSLTVETAVPANAVFTDTTYSNVSELANDANYITTETDPVFTAWDKSSGISITESQISDLGNYELADNTILKDADIGVTLQAYDADIVSDASYVHTDNNYTNAEKALVASALQAETPDVVTSVALVGNILTYTDETGTDTDIDLSLYLDDTNLARLVSGAYDSDTTSIIFTRDDASTFSVDASAFIGGGLVTSVNGQTGDVTITETDPIFTASQAANITAQMITDLGNLSGTNTGDQDLTGYATTASLAAVATSGSYNDLTDTPSAIDLTGDVVPNTTLAHDLGSSTKYWDTTYTQNLDLDDISVAGRQVFLYNNNGLRCYNGVPGGTSVSGYLSGSATFLTGSTYTVNDSRITSDWYVTIIPTGNPAGTWTVESSSGSFTITSTQSESSVTFDWNAVGDL